MNETPPIRAPRVHAHDFRPHICTLRDVGREGDTDYLVMEPVEGERSPDSVELD